MAHNCHGKVFLLTAKSIWPRQNQFRHGKINFATAKSISPRQNQFHHGKINFITAKSISSRQNQCYTRHNQFHNTAQSISHTAQSISQYGKVNFTHGKINFTHNKIIFTHGKINFTTAKSFWPYCSRDIGSQSAMGVNPTWRSTLWSRESCIARTVEVVCFQQHISACSVDKVSRNWLMNVFKYTQCILPFLFCDWLTFLESQVALSSRVRRIFMKGMFITNKLLVNLC